LSAERVVDDALLQAYPLPQHGGETSKYDRGTVLVIGGATQTLGATLLAGIAALRAGAGRLQVLVDDEAVVPFAIALPEARVSSLAQSEALVPGADAVLVGPGILDAEHGEATMDMIAPHLTPLTTLVVDAGALAGEKRVRGRARTIAIPNVAEAARLLDIASDSAGAHPRRTLDALVEQLRMCVALRDATTWIGELNGERFLDDSGHAALATSGSGDVAGGIIAGLAARGAAPLTATLWAVHTHGRCGERQALRFGGIGAIARDLLDEIPALLNRPSSPATSQAHILPPPVSE
jgi:ADP-dependent NAD(P)H-hydrate dehydratase